ncbi:hypothetical protein CARUB_v10010932mg [Capsella rubella]|uniref:Uncharacterized protein n=1 Tax=Capsella rubella TaxID=81985 RepID=R0IJZ0_9BRAS|nr:uncharacterized protein LOC17897414 [Capsella rubella]EOA37298.1 hypothetical protein CARUB_v10010932mg [Capsella rubella]
MASSTLISSMLFLLLLMFSLHPYEALGSQTKIRKLKEMNKVRRNLEGNDYKSSKSQVEGSVSNKCHSKISIEIVTTYLSNESSSPCIQCNAGSCYSCTTTRKCTWSSDSHRTYRRCTVTELCCLIIRS